MKLRTKLLVGYAGFVIALGALGAWSARTLLEMSAVSGRIIAENYDSVVAAQAMKESLERLDSSALFDLAGAHARAAQQQAEHRRRFDAAFATAAANITEPGEGEVVDAIRLGRDEYYRRLDAFRSAANDRRPSEYFAALEPQFNRLRADCDRLWRLNQEAMRRKADAASRTARRWFLVTLALAISLMAAGIGVEVRLSRAILGPVRQLTTATTRVAGGDLEAVVPVQSTDEIGSLAAGFNEMAERIRELRRSDMGRLLVAQQTTEAAINSLYDPVLVTDDGGRVRRINPAGERVFGASDRVLGRPIAEVAREPRVAQAVADVLHSGLPVTSENMTAVLPWTVDGANHAFRVRSTPMHDAGGHMLGAVTLLEDVTHLSEISRLKSEFVANASHELRTPLTSLQMGIHLLLEDPASSLSSRQQEILEICRQDTARLDRLMRELLDLSKIESGADVPVRAPVRPSVVIRTAVESLRLPVEARGLRLDVDAPLDLPEIDVDRVEIERVIANLVTNAARATPAGGSIAVSAAQRDRLVAISVADTGSGIPGEFLPRIFEPFVQVPNAPPGGAGLGLAISRRIIEAHGGQLTAQSEPAKGSIFTFTVPIVEGART